jgi:hypothetical protein
MEVPQIQEQLEKQDLQVLQDHKELKELKENKVFLIMYPHKALQVLVKQHHHKHVIIMMMSQLDLPF